MNRALISEAEGVVIYIFLSVARAYAMLTADYLEHRHKEHEYWARFIKPVRLKIGPESSQYYIRRRPRRFRIYLPLDIRRLYHSFIAVRLAFRRHYYTTAIAAHYWRASFMPVVSRREMARRSRPCRQLMLTRMMLSAAAIASLLMHENIDDIYRTGSWWFPKRPLFMKKCTRLISQASNTQKLRH